MNPEALILFLDFDGVLHPDEAYLVQGGPVLRSQDDPAVMLFCWAPILEDLLENHPHTQLVLSTSWVRLLGFDRALGWLPPGLQVRVVGATWHSRADQYEWGYLGRCEQVLRYVNRHRLCRWVAVDDDGEHWPHVHRDRLVLTDGALGLSDPEAQDLLANRLRQLSALAG